MGRHHSREGQRTVGVRVRESDHSALKFYLRSIWLDCLRDVRLFGLNNFLEQTEPRNCGTCERRAWGSMLFPDIRILTKEGVSEIDDCRNLPNFAHENPFAQANAVISGCEYPGFRRPAPTDHIAVLIAESRGGIPHQWFQKVIEANYAAGLRFFARCTDLGDLAYSEGEMVRSTVFYSKDDAEHYAALTEEPMAVRPEDESAIRVIDRRLRTIGASAQIEVTV